MNINNFLSALSSRNGVAHNGRFRVNIIPPTITGTVKNINNFISNGLGGLIPVVMTNRYFPMFGIEPIQETRMLELFATKASFPEVNYFTTERKTYGPETKIPYQTKYENMQVEFICTSGMKEKYFFDAWINMVRDPISNDFNFLTEYSTIIVIRQFDLTDSFQYGVRLVDAYPISLNAIDLSSTKNEIIKLTVDFAFRKWENLKAIDTVVNEIGAVISGARSLNNLVANTTSDLNFG